MKEICTQIKEREGDWGGIMIELAPGKEIAPQGATILSAESGKRRWARSISPLMKKNGRI